MPTVVSSCWNSPGCPPSPLEQLEKLEQLRVLALGKTILVSIVDQPTRRDRRLGGLSGVCKIGRASAKMPSQNATGRRRRTMAKHIFVTGGVVSSLGKGLPVPRSG